MGEYILNCIEWIGCIKDWKKNLETKKVCFVVVLERSRMANPIPNVSAPMQTAPETQLTLIWALNASTRQSPSPTAPREEKPNTHLTCLLSHIASGNVQDIEGLTPYTTHQKRAKRNISYQHKRSPV